MVVQHPDAFGTKFECILLSILGRVAFVWPAGKIGNKKTHLLVAIMCDLDAIV